MYIQKLDKNLRLGTLREIPHYGLGKKIPTKNYPLQ